MTVGQVVILDGLQSRAELNDHLAVVLELGERWRCQVVATGERVRLQPANILSLDGHAELASASRPPRERVRAADFPTLQAAVDAAPPEGHVVEIEKHYNEVVRITRPVSLVGSTSRDGEDDKTELVPKLWMVAGLEVDHEIAATPCKPADLVELRNLQVGSAASWMGGAGLRVFDGSPVVVNCTIGGMFAVRVDSFKVRSCPALVGNRLEGRLGGVWWDGACWETLPDRKEGAPPVSPAIALEVGGLPKFVLEVAAANKFSGDLQWVCCVDSGIMAMLTGEHVMPLEMPGPEDSQRQALAAEIKACGWFVHRPTLALMDRPEIVKQRAAWAVLASETENAVRLEVQTRKMFAEAEQIRHWRQNGDLLPEDIMGGDVPGPDSAKIEEVPWDEPDTAGYRLAEPPRAPEQEVYHD